jgi:uncharacterized protein (DUF58 family)
LAGKKNYPRDIFKWEDWEEVRVKMPESKKPANPEDGRSFAAQPSGYLLHKGSLYVLGGLLLLSAWKGQTGIVILLGLVLSVAGLAAFWSRLSLAGVRCRRLIGEKRLFPGESTELRLELFNRKPLPLPWVKIDDEIPADLGQDLDPTPATRPGYYSLTRWASVLWYRKVGWKFQIYGKKRGYYPLGSLTATSGDIFGFYPRWRQFASADHVLVYPRVFPIEQMEVPSLHPMGEARTRRRIFQDPTRPIGLRDYRPQDSLKYIHWKATARRQELQVKVFEPTTTLKVSIFLAGDGYSPKDPQSEEEFELAVSAAASLALHLIDQGTPVGLISNGCQADSGLEIQIPPGGSRDQLMEILEALAKVTLRAKISSEAFLQSQSKSWPSGTTLILVVSQVPESFFPLLRDLKDRGTKLLLLRVGDQQEGGLDGTIPSYPIRKPGDLLTINPESSL